MNIRKNNYINALYFIQTHAPLLIMVIMLAVFYYLNKASLSDLALMHFSDFAFMYLFMLAFQHFTIVKLTKSLKDLQQKYSKLLNDYIEATKDSGIIKITFVDDSNETHQFKN